jgi:response regulator of citrate/malate metabolism
MNCKASGENPLITQRKIVRVFAMLELLVKKRSVDELATALEVSQKTIHRYLYLLEEIGFGYPVFITQFLTTIIKEQ